MRPSSCFFCSSITWAQATEEPETESDAEPEITEALVSVTLTEISPHSIGEADEWFEFFAPEGDKESMRHWQVSNTRHNPKVFDDFWEDLVEGEDGYFFWKKSPASLTNDGGTIELLDEQGVVLDSVTYTKAKSGTSGGLEYAEVWNRGAGDRWFPLVVKEGVVPGFEHSRGQANRDAPTFPEDVELLITEASPKRKDASDFIELFVKSSQKERANLRYLEIKHNGTPLVFLEHDFWVKEGDYVVIVFDEGPFRIEGKTMFTSAKTGLSSGSGTVEVILYSGTSWEHREDFLCWMNETLSQGENARVTKILEDGDWASECQDVRDIVHNESVARKITHDDTNTKEDFFRHFNGSKGDENLPQNHPPNPVIRVQGNGESVRKAPFSLNVTGEDSTDQDGDHDLKTFQWRINGELFSEKENPASFRIEHPGTYAIELLVEDYSGEVSSVSLVATALASSGGSSSAAVFDKTEKQSFETLFQEQKERLLRIDDGGSSSHFFGDFLSRTSLAPERLLYEPISFRENTHTPQKEVEAMYPPVALRRREPKSLEKRMAAFQRDRFTAQERQRIGKNLGRIWD